MASFDGADKNLTGLTNSTSLSEEASVQPTSNQLLGSTDDHIFTDPVIADYWRKVYEKAKYENRHRFDPSYTWTAEEERKLVRKVC